MFLLPKNISCMPDSPPPIAPIMTINMNEHTLTKELMEQGIYIKQQPSPILYIIKHKDLEKTISFTEGKIIPCVIINCQYRIEILINENKECKLQWNIICDSILIRGILNLLISPLQNKNKDDLKKIDWIRVESCWPNELLNSGRGGSLRNIMARIAKTLQEL